jgi:hypothetical protein
MRNEYPESQRMNNVEARVLDRDCVFVPSGWDTVGKILLLDESFSLTEHVISSGYNQVITKEIIVEYGNRIKDIVVVKV